MYRKQSISVFYLALGTISAAIISQFQLWSYVWSRSRWLSGLRRGCGYHRGHVRFSLGSVVCFGQGYLRRADHSSRGILPCVCVCVCVCPWVWSDATVTLCTYSVHVEEVTLRKKIKLESHSVTEIFLRFPRTALPNSTIETPLNRPRPLHFYPSQSSK